MDDISVKSIDEVAPYSGANAIPGIRFRAMRPALGVSSWGMNVIELDPECSGYPEHDHASDGHEEVYVVLKGSVVILAGGSGRDLNVGDFVRVPGSVKRKFVTRERGATLLALGGTPGKPYAASLGG